MAWYSNYLTIFGKSYPEITPGVMQEIAQKIAKKNKPDPIASVVVIAHNEEKHLAACLWSLADNQCNYPLEIIGVNNNSSDQTDAIFRAAGIIPLFEEQESPGYARRCGLNQAKGNYYICIDSDTLYPPRYIQTVIEQLQQPGVVAVSSLWSFIPDKNHSRLGLKIYEFFRDIHIRTLFIKRPELAVRGMVLAYKTEYGKEVGYRVDIIRGEDGSMAHGLMNYGKVKLLTSRKTRAISGTGTLSSDGSLWKSFKVRFLKALKGLKKYFTKQKQYKDQKDNLIKK